MFQRMGMFKKIAIAFVAFILVPVTLVLAFTFRRMYADLRMELTNEQWRRIEQVHTAIDGKIERIESISSTIASNGQLINLLSRPYSQNVDAYLQYRTQAAQAIAQAFASNRDSIWRIRLFFLNESVPEGWDTFYRAERAADRDWFTQMIGQYDSAWFKLNGKRYFSHHNLNDTLDEDLFILMKTVRDYVGNPLGVLAIEVRAGSMLEAYNMALLDDGFVSDMDGAFLHVNENAGALPLDEVSAAIASAKLGESLRLRDRILLVDTLPKLSLAFGILTDAAAYRSLSLSMGLYFAAVGLGLGAALLTFIQMQRRMIRQINVNLGIMTQAVQGDLSLRVPVVGDDEISRIARHFNQLIELVDELIRDRVQKEIAQRDAQLNDLQYRINPHFFYNTLDILAGSMVLAGQHQIAEAVSDFGKMLRYNLRGGLTGTLKQEMQYIQSYMQVQAVRFGDRIHLEISLPEALSDRQIIKFILQPIVENCILHGYQDVDLNIAITIEQDADRALIIAIEDDGHGIDAENLDLLNGQMEDSAPPSRKNGLGIGLNNISERLKLYYGDGASVRIDSESGHHTIVTLIIPYKGERSEPGAPVTE